MSPAAKAAPAGYTIKAPMDETEGLGRPADVLPGSGPRHRPRRALGARRPHRQARRPRRSSRSRTSPACSAPTAICSLPGIQPASFAAYDADTLKELWSFSLGTPITAPPMSYSVGGKQYVAVVAGGEPTHPRRGALSAVRDRRCVRAAVDIGRSPFSGGDMEDHIQRGSHRPRRRGAGPTGTGRNSRLTSACGRADGRTSGWCEHS